MRQGDSDKRIRAAIIDVMEAYGVPYQDTRRHNHPAITFTVGDQTRTLTYVGGDPRAHLNAKTQARRLLHELGAVPVSKENPMESDHATYADPATTDQPQDTSTPDEISIDEPVKTTTRTPQGYVVFSPIKYSSPQYQLTSGRFIAIRLNRELIAESGKVLVIPLDLENVVWDMPEHEFQCCFEPVPPAAIQQPSEPVVKAESEPPLAEPIENEYPSQAALEPIIEQPHIEDFIDAEAVDEDEAEDELTHYPPPRQAKPAGKRVAPQMGRILLAMWHLHGNGQTDIAPAAIQALVSPVDAKQVSGVLGGGMKLGLVARGEPIGVGRGWFYKLSAAGQITAANLGTAPYDDRDLAVPEWLQMSLNAVGTG